MEQFVSTQLSWKDKDIADFEQYLMQLKNTEEKCKWEQNIVKTKLPCLAIGNEKIRQIINEIYKGNYFSFLRCMLWNNHSETLINAGLISKIKYFENFSQFLYDYAEKCDNWASCDALKFNVKFYDKHRYLHLSELLMKNKSQFVRRIGFRMLFPLVKYDEFLDDIFDLIEKAYDENEYYVNMCVAWLLCELFIKKRDLTLKFIQTARLNQFVIQKLVSKCNDSFRVTAEDKLLLKTIKDKKLTEQSSTPSEFTERVITKKIKK